MKKRKGTRFLSILLALCVIATTGVISPLHTGAESVDSAPVTEEASQEQTAEASVSPAAEVSSAGTQEAASETEETAAVTEETAAPQDGQQSVSPAAAEETQQQAAAAGSSTDAAASGEDTSSAADGTEAATAEEPAANAAEETPVEEGQEEAVSYPEQSFTGTANNVTVNVYAPEGVFPEGTTMSVTGVSSETAMSIAGEAADSGTEVVDAIGVDITFRDASGQEIEPKDGQSVQVSMSVEAGSALSGDSFSVVHQEDTGAVETVTQEAFADGAVFTAYAFSIYVITGAGTAQQTPAVETWNFYGADNTTLLSTQSVKNGETIVSPETPEKDGYLFQGWAYSVESAASGMVDVTAFTTRTVDVSIPQTINLYPVFSQKLYVFFTDTYGRVWQTKEGKEGDKISTSDVTLPLGSEKSVTGWYTDSALAGEAVTEVTLDNSDVKLYPKVESGHYLFFSSGEGASYVAPQFVSANAVTAKPADPTRSGYTFVGWSASPDSATADYTFGGNLTENTTVYAVWEAKADTKYTVIYWKQSVNDDKNKNADDSQKTYDYAGSDTRTGTSGQTVSPMRSDQNKGYTGFHYNSSKSVAVTINGDGTTILNVYYDRNTLTIDFYKYSRNWIGGTWTKDDTFTGLYGQTLAQNGYTWPSEYDWYNRSESNRLTFLDAFIFDTLDEFGDTTSISLYRYDSSGSYTINHYKQNLDGSYSDDSPTNSTKTKGGTFYFSNKYNGFTIDSYSTDGMRTWKAASVEGSTDYYPNLYIRYRRNSYPLSFYNYNRTAKTESVLYEASLSSYADYVPDRPSDLSDEFTFEGWYKDPELTQKFDFNQTMPAGGITLYAKWAEPTYNGTVHLTIDGSGTSTGLTIGYGATISEADMPTVVDADDKTVFQGNDKNTVTLPKDVDWIGWATKDGTQYTAFHFATQIYSDITLYPYYVSKTKYTVAYDVNGGSGTVADSKNYASGAYADIQSGDGVTAPEGKAFLYWNTDKEGNGISYYPGDKLQVTDKVTLYAVYGDPAETTSLTYKTNYPAGSVLEDADKLQSVNGSETLQNNASFQALTLADAGFAVPEGYYFTGWNTAENGSRTPVAAGMKILVDAKGTNTLYAQWEKKQAVVLTVTGKTESVPYDGKEHSVKGYTTAITVDEAAATALPGNLKLDEEKAKAKAATGTDAKTYKIGLVERDFSITGSDLEKYSVTVQVTDGSLAILPRTVTLTSASAKKQYDGTALTAPNVTIGSLGFVKGEVTSVTATGSQTAVGTSDNKPIEIVKGTNYKDSNYEITEDYGTLTVTQSTAAFTITAKGAEKTYDGTALTENGYTVTKPQGFEKFEVTAVVSGTITDAGTADNIVDSYTIKDPSGKDVTRNFTNVTTLKGTLTVKCREVTLHSESKEKEYDGTALTAPAVTTSDPAFVDGEVTDIKAIGTITDVGSVTNTISYTGTEKFKAANYDIKLDEGKLTVSKSSKKITVTAESAEKTYDGTALTNNKYEVDGLPDGFSVSDVTVTGSATNVTDTKSGNNVVTGGKILNAEGKDVTEYFANITRINGTLKILPRQVKLTSATDSKKYDGVPLTNSTVTEGGDKFVSGEVTDLKATGSQTEKGTSNNPISYNTVTGKFRAENYEIEEVIGTLTVYAADTELVLTAPSGTWEYDGTVHSTGNNVTTTWPSADDAAKYTVFATVSGSVKDVADGTVANVIDTSSIKITDSTGKDVTGNFDTSKIKTVNGTLSVYARQVTLTSESAEKPYDGTALTAPDVTVSGSGFVKGEVSNLKATGSALTTDDGEVINTIEWTAGKNFDSRNYTIVKHEGKLKITQNQAVITVTAGSATKVYDGKVLTNSAATVTGLPKGFTATVTVEGSAKKVSDTTTGNNKVAAVKITKDEKDVTNQFANITKKDGTLTITKRPVTLKSESGSKPYDGTALELPKVTITGDGFVDGEIAEGSIKATGSITEVGSVTNSITYSPKLLGNFDEDNYVIIKEEGTLSISKAEIAFRVTANNHTWPYDGKAHTDSGYTVTIPDNYKETYGKFTVEAVVEGSVTNVTKKPVANKITNVTVKEKDGLLSKDVTGQFDIDDMILVDGELQISPVKLTLTSDSGTKEYDGTPLELPKVKVEGSIIKTNDKAQITNIRATGSVTGVTTDPIPNTIAYDTSEDFIRDNYVIIMKEGTLTVTKNTKAEIVFTAKDAAKTYDGTPLTEPGVEVKGLPDGFTAQAEAGGSITNVAQTAEGNNPVVKAIILDKDGKNVTDWFKNVTKTAGTLTITPREITLTSADAKKPYDGTPLEKKEVTVTGTHGLADTHTIEYTFTGSQTYVGSSLNTFTYLIKDKEGNVIPASEVTAASKKSSRAAVQDSVQKGNYNITVVYGTLTVTDKVEPGVVVTKNHEEKAYQLGEQIVFEIKVTNIYDTAQTITLTEQDGVVFTGPDTFTDVQPGESVTTSAYHVVNEEDLAKGSYTNTVKAAFKEAEKTWEGTDEEDQFAHLTLAKEVTNAPANGTAYVNGETVNYRITVTNDGTAKLYSLNIADVMTGDEWNNIQSLAPGEKLTFETSWKVTDKDVENGYVRNQAVGNAKDANDNYVRPQPASVQVPVQKAKSSLYVEKTSDKDKAVELGETIHYIIRVVNNGNTPVSDIVVTDEMTGDSWDAGTLKPGEDKTFRTEYVVTEKDILAGSVKNVALADGKDPNGDKPDVTPGEKEDKTVPENSHLTLTKTTTSSPKNRSGYAAGETIRYRIEAVNDGNLTLTDVEVKDPLTGETWKVEKLAPGEKQTFETKYTVTEKDQNAGKVVNEATAKGKTPGSSELIVVPGKTSDPVLPKAAASVTVSNTVQTGDPTQTGAYLAMLFVAAGGILVLARKKKKERRK